MKSSTYVYRQNGRRGLGSRWSAPAAPYLSTRAINWKRLETLIDARPRAGRSRIEGSSFGARSSRMQELRRANANANTNANMRSALISIKFFFFVHLGSRSSCFASASSQMRHNQPPEAPPRPKYPRNRGMFHLTAGPSRSGMVMDSEHHPSRTSPAPCRHTPTYLVPGHGITSAQ